MFEKKLRLGNLFAFYGHLLTEKQQEILKSYCIDDLSLSEISENLNISRQAVYDALKRSENILEDYEEKLCLLKKFSSTRHKINYLVSYIDNFSKQIDKRFDKDFVIEGILNIKKMAMGIWDESS